VRARGHRDVTYVGDLDQLMVALRARLQPGDVLITLGAGNITRVGRDLLAELSGGPSHGA
jgi:UDP-N-acetylmuramate--alanine ligase